MISGTDIDRLCERVNDIARSKGFWEGVTDPAHPGTIAVKLMLIVSEVAEALKADRDTENDQLRTYDILEELADVVIRACDLAHQVSGHGAKESFGRILLDKIETNRQRPMHHGKRY